VSAPEPNEHATAVLALARTLLEATAAMEQSDWVKCEKAAYSAARQARMLLLAERQDEKEVKWKAGDTKKT